MNGQVALEGLFFRLVRDEGFPLGIRDLKDALHALEAGFGGCSRERLLWLCQTLWARSGEERRRLALLFERNFPPLTAEQLAAITGSTPAAGPEPAPAPKPVDTSPRQGREAQLLEIAPAETRSGVGVPRASVPAVRRELFVLTPKPLVPLRACIVTWRRYRKALRLGPKVDLDLEQTVAAKARFGALSEPVLAPRRANQACLVLLIDVGPSMAAWGQSIAVLVESLAESQLAQSKVWFFHQTPERLFASERLTGPVAVRSAANTAPDTPVLVVSDAGAVRGGMDRARINGTRSALMEFGTIWRPVAWLNPMPRDRWRSTSAASIARLPGVSMVPFSPDGLIAAVDLLRGHRAS
jgi:uncharacterized protein with von Willebrand factor type A (vWA) domain